MSQLKAQDRDALALRYFKKLSAAEVATALGISERAAHKRVSRALERLRAFFARKGVAASSEGLASMLAVNVMAAAPEQLSAQIVQSAISHSIATKGVILMAAAKTKVTIAVCAGVVLAAIAVPVIYHMRPEPAPVVAASATTQMDDSQARLNSIYGLAPAQNVKRIVPPFIAERSLALPASVRPTPNDPGVVFAWDEGFITFTDGKTNTPWQFSEILKVVLGIWPQDSDLPREVTTKAITGDWVVREKSTQQQRILDVCTAASDILGNGMTLRAEPMEREAIVVTGTYKHATPLTFAEGGRVTIVVVTPRKMLQVLGEMLGRPIVTQTDLDQPDRLRIVADNTFNFDLTDTEKVDQVLANISRQTGLGLKRERQIVPTWRLVQAGSDDWQSRFNSVYGLAPGQNVKRIVPPFVTERQQAVTSPGFAGRPQTAVFDWNGSIATWRMVQPRDLSQVIRHVAGIWPQETDLPATLLATPINSDWVVRQGASHQMRIMELCMALPEVFGNEMALQGSITEREVIVISSQTPPPLGLNLRSTPEAVQNFGQMLGYPIVLEADVAEKDLQQFIKANQSGRGAQPPDAAAVDEMLSQMAQKTALVLKREKRSVPIWKLAAM